MGTGHHGRAQEPLVSQDLLLKVRELERFLRQEWLCRNLQSNEHLLVCVFD